MRTASMSILLFIVGVIALVAGVVAGGVWIPVREVSFGNTLITSGATVGIGGLILIGLGAVVSQLKRIAEGLGAALNERAAHSAETFEAASASAPARGAAAAAPEAGRIPFPARPK